MGGDMPFTYQQHSWKDQQPSGFLPTRQSDIPKHVRLEGKNFSWAGKNIEVKFPFVPKMWHCLCKENHRVLASTAAG
jgi:hypothetical protein